LGSGRWKWLKSRELNKNSIKDCRGWLWPCRANSCCDLQQLGYSVTVFEAFHETGGVLTYGIPEFRLPKSIVGFEINYLKEMGVRIELNHVIGKIITIDELLESFNAVSLGWEPVCPNLCILKGRVWEMFFLP